MLVARAYSQCSAVGLAAGRRPTRSIMDRFAETEGKRAHDPLYSPRRAARATATGFPVGEHGEVLAGPVIVGAGPAGLAVAACLTMWGIPYVLLERHGGIASLWRHRTYRRLRLHLPKRYCELPLMPFPPSYPAYPTREQFLAYLEDYIATFGIRPFFCQAVVSAEHDGDFWCVRAVDGGSGGVTRVYRSKWLVVATGENAEPVVPDIDGINAFRGLVMHSSDYCSGEGYRGKKVLVVGCGNSGMEVSLDLSNHNVHTSMVVRDSVRRSIFMDHRFHTQSPLSSRSSILILRLQFDCLCLGSFCNCCSFIFIYLNK